MIKENSVYNKDCIELMRCMSNNSVDLTLTDIPFGEINSHKSNGLRNLDKGIADIATFNTIEFVREVCRVTKKSCYIFAGTEQISDIRRTMVEQKMSTRLLIIQKSNPSPMNAKYIFLSDIECCVFGKKPKATFNEFYKGCVLRYPVTRKAIHPTQKNQDMLEELIKISSNENDIIFDPCAGSGSTLLAANKLNRKYIGCELSLEYYNVILDRLII